METPAKKGQASVSFGTPSLSMSLLQASPWVATNEPHWVVVPAAPLQVIFWSAFGMLGQLSPTTCLPFTITVAPGAIACQVPLTSCLSGKPSPSRSGSQTSPMPLPLVSR